MRYLSDEQKEARRKLKEAMEKTDEIRARIKAASKITSCPAKSN